MPWDYFCPKCSATLVGGMINKLDEIERDIDKYRGKVIHCDLCGAYSDFNMHEIITNIKGKEIIEGG